MFGDQRRGLVRRVLAWPGLLWIGTLSYAILWHTTVLNTLSKSGIPGDVARATGLQGWIVYVVLGLAGTTVIALLSQRFVEDPAMSLKRRNPFQAREGESLAPAFRLALAGGGLAMTALGLVGTRYATVDAFLVLAGAVILGSMVLRARWTAARLPAPTLLAAALAAAAVALAGVVLGSPRTTAAQGLLPVAHLAETVGGGRIQLFVNGRRVAETTYRGRPDAGVGPLEVGAYASRANTYGVIDKVALYRSVLTPTDVAEHYQLGLVAASEYESTVAGAPGVMSYWRLSDPPGADARNVVSGGRAGIYGANVRHRVHGLVAGPDTAAGFDGRTARLKVDPAPRLGPRYTVEAWVASGTPISSRVVVARVGGFFIRTDAYGRWAAGVFTGGRPVVATSSQTARVDRPEAADRGIATLIGGLLAALATGCVALLWWRRSRSAGPVRHGPGSTATATVAGESETDTMYPALESLSVGRSPSGETRESGRM